jgi:hypothetical protein
LLNSNSLLNNRHKRTLWGLQHRLGILPISNKRRAREAFRMSLLILKFLSLNCKLLIRLIFFSAESLKAKIKAELNQQVKLSEKVLPSIAQIDIYQTYKLLTAVTLSESGNIMVCGFQDSLIKVFQLVDSD